MSTFGKCNGGGRRSATRVKAPLIAVLTTLTDSHAAVLVDISRSGVRLRGDDLPPTGQELIVSIESVRSFGSVAWKHDGECGIAFDGPLPPGDVQLIRQKAAKGAGFAPELRAAFDDWTLGLAR